LQGGSTSLGSAADAEVARRVADAWQSLIPPGPADADPVARSHRCTVAVPAWVAACLAGSNQHGADSAALLGLAGRAAHAYIRRENVAASRDVPLVAAARAGWQRAASAVQHTVGADGTSTVDPSLTTAAGAPLVRCPMRLARSAYAALRFAKLDAKQQEQQQEQHPKQPRTDPPRALEMGEKITCGFALLAASAGLKVDVDKLAAGTAAVPWATAPPAALDPSQDAAVDRRAPGGVIDTEDRSLFDAPGHADPGDAALIAHCAREESITTIIVDADSAAAADDDAEDWLTVTLAELDARIAGVVGRAVAASGASAGASAGAGSTSSSAAGSDPTSSAAASAAHSQSPTAPAEALLSGVKRFVSGISEHDGVESAVDPVDPFPFDSERYMRVMARHLGMKASELHPEGGHGAKGTDDRFDVEDRDAHAHDSHDDDDDSHDSRDDDNDDDSATPPGGEYDTDEDDDSLDDPGLMADLGGKDPYAGGGDDFDFGDLDDDELETFFARSGARSAAGGGGFDDAAGGGQETTELPPPSAREMRAVMAAMDAALGGQMSDRRGARRGQEQSSSGPGDDADMELLRNMMKALEAEGGAMGGPTAAMLESMGVNVADLLQGQGD
jgi:hypothetical protein